MERSSAAIPESSSRVANRIDRLSPLATRGERITSGSMADERTLDLDFDIIHDSLTNLANDTYLFNIHVCIYIYISVIISAE